MGHLTRICNTIINHAYGNPHTQVPPDEVLKSYLAEIPGWEAFQNGALKNENDRLNTILGGQKPDAFPVEDVWDTNIGGLGGASSNTTTGAEMGASADKTAD